MRRLAVGGLRHNTDCRASFEETPESFGLLLGLHLQPFPIHQAIVEWSIAGAIDHPARELGLLVQHTQRDTDAFLDALRLRLQQLRRFEAAQAIP
jgi:hypothetical protein